MSPTSSWYAFVAWLKIWTRFLSEVGKNEPQEIRIAQNLRFCVWVEGEGGTRGSKWSSANQLGIMRFREKSRSPLTDMESLCSVDFHQCLNLLLHDLRIDRIDLCWNYIFNAANSDKVDLEFTWLKNQNCCPYCRSKINFGRVSVWVSRSENQVSSH